MITSSLNSPTDRSTSLCHIDRFEKWLDSNPSFHWGRPSGLVTLMALDLSRVNDDQARAYHRYPKFGPCTRWHTSPHRTPHGLWRYARTPRWPCGLPAPFNTASDDASCHVPAAQVGHTSCCDLDRHNTGSAVCHMAHATGMRSVCNHHSKILQQCEMQLRNLRFVFVK